MRSRFILAAALCAALAGPSAAAAGSPAQTGKADTAVAYFEGAGYCVILSLNDGTDRPVGAGMPSDSQWLSVQLLAQDGDCQPIAESYVSPDSFQIHQLTAAYVVVETLDVGDHHVSVDVAWVAVGTPRPEVEDNDGWSFVGKDVGAHLTGTVLVDGASLTPNQDNAILRSFAIVKNY